MVVDPVYPPFNCYGRRSSRGSSHKHESQNGAPLVRSVVLEAMEGEDVVGHLMIIKLSHSGHSSCHQ